MNVQTIIEHTFLKLISPFLLMILIYLMLNFMRIHQWRKIHLTAQLSAFIYVIGVVILINQLFEVFILSYVLIAFIIILAVHIIIQWKKEIEISLKKAIVLLLRIVFLLFFISYIIFVILYAIRFFA